MKKYVVELTSEERKILTDIIQAERMAAHKRRHARKTKVPKVQAGTMRTSPMPLIVRSKALSAFASGWLNAA